MFKLNVVLKPTLFLIVVTSIMHQTSMVASQIKSPNYVIAGAPSNPSTDHPSLEQKTRTLKSGNREYLVAL